MQDDLLAYQRGEIQFDEFARRTHSAWVALANYLLKRWQAPAVSVEDLMQEMLLACWRFVPKFQPQHGVSLHRYVVYNCCDKAKKFLHKQRNAYRREGKAPGRYEVSFSSLGLEPHAEERLLDAVSVAPEQEDRIDRAQALGVVVSDDLAFMYYQRSGGDIQAAARSIVGSPLARLALCATSVEAAMSVVEDSIERTARALVPDAVHLQAERPRQPAAA